MVPEQNSKPSEKSKDQKRSEQNLMVPEPPKGAIIKEEEDD